MDYFPIVIIGAGPAGLTAAYELARRGLRPLIFEKSDSVGGLARTEIYKGYRFDIGGHRFFTTNQEVQGLWETLLGEDFLKVPRLSRIFYQNRFFHYPLDFFDTFTKLGPKESLLILLSYLQARLRPQAQEENFEQWVSNRFGPRLYQTFFQGYTEKVWGIPCREISAEWASQRIEGLSLVTALANAIFGKNNVGKTLIKEFHYPIYGPGQMWERFQERVQQGGGQIDFQSKVIRLNREGRRISWVEVEQGEKKRILQCSQVISSMPLKELVNRIDPPPPDKVLEATHRLSYRDFILVGLIVNQAKIFPDQWIYIHSPKVRVGRIQNFGNWSAAMVPDPQKSSLGMEFFSNIGDDLWAMPDQDLIALAIKDLSALGLAGTGQVEDGVVFRQPNAYPVYNLGYQKHLEMVEGYLATLDNLQTVGRNGMHQYNNMDHSMLTALTAAKKVMEQKPHLWKISGESLYTEEQLSMSEEGQAKGLIL